MSTTETLRHDADQGVGAGPLPKCPKCGCDSLITTEFYQATRTEPGCSAGYCVCRESEMLSVCCGAPEHPDLPDYCGSCREHTGFERACECTYEWG